MLIFSIQVKKLPLRNQPKSSATAFQNPLKILNNYSVFTEYFTYTLFLNHHRVHQINVKYVMRHNGNDNFIQLLLLLVKVRVVVLLSTTSTITSNNNRRSNSSKTHQVAFGH